MPPVSKQSDLLSVQAYAGDFKTLLAFNILDKTRLANLAGFTIERQAEGHQPSYIPNALQFETPAAHAQDPNQPPNSSVNAPLHKFRWVDVPGSSQKGVKPVQGRYTYVVTPRYFDDTHALKPLDPNLSVSVDIEVGPFRKGKVRLGFTRGFVQSQAFVRHFGVDAPIRPRGKELLFDTSQVAGTNPKGEQFTFADEYAWLGFTAREQIFGLLDEVVGDDKLHVDVFAYDLSEPDLCRKLLDLAKQGRIRMILDNADLHHDKVKPDDPTKVKPEDAFEERFRAAATGSAEIKRGKFKRYAHDKVFIVSREGTPVKVLTGSTNFSVTGFYVNANHVLIFDDGTVVQRYSDVFDVAWNGDVKLAAFVDSPLSQNPFKIDDGTTPSTEITFSPHSTEDATNILQALVARVQEELTHDEGSVLFAVMELGHGPVDPTKNPVYAALRDLHADQRIFTYGISDSTDGIELYAPRNRHGVLVTGKPARTRLPPPFNQVPDIGLGHQVHHKFVVCGFNGADPVVYCGSSNLALLGEQENGDNLLAIRDADVATAFAIEALALVDHYDFLDRESESSKRDKSQPPPAEKDKAAVAAGWFLSTDGTWANPYYDQGDLHCVDRLLFAAK